MSDDRRGAPVDPDDHRRYVESYLLIRTVVGVLGLLLPIALIVGEVFFLRSGVHVRGSISAYYHSSMRDVFVGALCVIAVLLTTYMAGQRERPDFWWSLAAGIALLGLVFFPTQRPGLHAGDPRCGTDPAPSGCSPVQQALGERTTAVIHFSCATAFLVSIAVLCVYFGRRAAERGRDGRKTLQRACAVAIIAALAWAVLGNWLPLRLGDLTALYVGEVVAVWAFAVSWLAAGYDLWRRLLPGGGPGAPAQV